MALSSQAHTSSLASPPRHSVSDNSKHPDHISIAEPVSTPLADCHPSHKERSASASGRGSLEVDIELARQPAVATGSSDKETTVGTVLSSPALTSLHQTSNSSTENLVSPSNNSRHRQFSPSTSSLKQNRASLLSLAALARDKTTSAIAIANTSLRSRSSSGNLYRAAQNTSSNSASYSPQLAELQEDLTRSPTNSTSTSAFTSLKSKAEATSSPIQLQPLLETTPPSRPYTKTALNTPAPTTGASKANNKMHQTSSRLLRMTSDDRPFTRDFKDLFSTLVVSLPLAPHRIRLTRIDHSFLSEEAINNLGSLKFSQSNRMPDPKDPSRIVTTTTTTTFSMAREMARSVCQRFLDARFIESADGKQAKEFVLKGAIWQLTPKGIHVLERFCGRNGIQQKHITELLNSSRNTMQLVILERDVATDKLSFDRGTIEVIFQRFVGTNGPNVKSSTSSADSDSLSEYKDGIAGVKMASERKIGSPARVVHQTFTGKAATDWLMDCCTTVDRRETVELAASFLDYEFISCVQSDKSYLIQTGQDKEKNKVIFQPTKAAIYQLTQKGKDIISMTRDRTSESEGSNSMLARSGVSRDSNTQKLEKILNDPALRLLFRENLRDTHCEENLSFYLDVSEFLNSCRNATRNASPSRSGKGSSGLDAVKETMASAYGIYNAFLAPGSPCELNIDHMLRHQLATRMTKAVGQDAAMVESLKEVTKLFEEAQTSVFKLMASDSVPKFMKSTKYEQTLKNYDLDSLAPPSVARFVSPAPERSMSKSNR